MNLLFFFSRGVLYHKLGNGRSFPPMGLGGILYVAGADALLLSPLVVLLVLLVVLVQLLLSMSPYLPLFLLRGVVRLLSCFLSPLIFSLLTLPFLILLERSKASRLGTVSHRHGHHRQYD